MKKFFGEFKTFITRGNVVDMAVGIIIGGAFTAIVTALTNYVLTPIIKWVLALIFGANSLDQLYTYLVKAMTTDVNGVEVVDLANSIYIDWGALIGAIINFILIAFVLFLIIKAINSAKDKKEKLKANVNSNKLTKEDYAKMREQGIDKKDKKAVEAYIAQRNADAAAKLEAEKKAAEEAANAPSQEVLLLTEIRDALKNK